MSRFRIRALLIGVATFGLALGASQLAVVPAQAAQPQPEMATVYYSASDYQAEAAEAAQIWTDAVSNLTMEEGGDATITIAGTTGGGSRAYPCGLGCAEIFIDSQDIAAGHDALRIVSHEIGHGHTLPDNYNGDCDLLMSGGSAGTSCDNPSPNAQEAAEVDSAYGSGVAVDDNFETDVYAPARAEVG